MKRTTIFLDETVERDLRLLAQRREKPMAALVREALQSYVTDNRLLADELPAFVGAGQSGLTDTAERHEEILFSDLEPHATASVAPRRRPKSKRG